MRNAAKVALAAVPGGTLVGIESENRGAAWEVDIVTSDGTKHEVKLSGDGSAVLSGPTTTPQSAGDKAKYQSRVAAAKLDYLAALERLEQRMPGGRVTELDLDTEHGSVVWEADVIDGSGTKHEFDVDALTGTVTDHH